MCVVSVVVPVIIRLGPGNDEGDSPSPIAPPRRRLQLSGGLC
jgi:hypothetical protein